MTNFYGDIKINFLIFLLRSFMIKALVGHSLEMHLSAFRMELDVFFGGDEYHDLTWQKAEKAKGMDFLY